MHRHFRPTDERARRQWQDPEAILAEVGLRPGDTFIDIGCGDGFFALPAARIVGETGNVYGIDIDPAQTARLNNKVAASGMKNVSTVTAAAEDTVLCTACADIVFFGIVLHDFADPARVLRNARLMVKPDGRLANVDWKKEPAPFGPPLGVRFDQARAAGLIEAAGFRVSASKDSGQHHYLIIAEPV